MSRLLGLLLLGQLVTSKVARVAENKEVLQKFWPWDEHTTEAPDEKLDNCDEKKFPNIEEGFRGYNVIRGTMMIGGTDLDGYRSMIFDYNKEKCAQIPFGNIAGHNLASCSSHESFQFIESSSAFVKKTGSSSGSGGGFQVGSETKVSVTIPLEEAGIPAEVGLEATIPPLYQTSGSNSKNFQNMMAGADSKSISIGRLSKKCSAYTYSLQPYSPLPLHSGFKNALQKLSHCWNHTAIIEQLTKNKCAQDFLNSYGTHYIKSATFGALITTTSVMDRVKANSASSDFRRDCTKSSSGWSLFGLVGNSHTKEECNNLMETSKSVQESGLDAITTVTVGKRLEEFKDPSLEYSPEIIQRNLAPLSELFTEHYMGNLHPPIDYDAIRPWIDGKITNYCQTFKAQHHCNHAVR